MRVPTERKRGGIPRLAEADQGFGPVAVFDPLEERSHHLLQVISQCGTSAYLLPSRGSLVRAPGTCSLAFVALGDSSERDARLSLIRDLKQNGSTILAYEDGLRAWPLAERCRALLAGAAKTLDSAEEQFATEASAHLADLLAKHTE